MNLIFSKPGTGVLIGKAAKELLRKLLILMMICIVLFPFIWLLTSSFKEEKDIMSFPPRVFSDHYTVDNYTFAFSFIPMLTYIWNTILFAGSVTLFSVFFDSMAGYAFSRIAFKGKTAVYSLILLTLMVPFQVIMIPLFVEEHKLGILNSFVGLLLPRMTCAYGIFMMRTFFWGLPKNLEEAARIDGENEIGIYFRIMLPLAKPGMVALGIYLLMTNWNDLTYPLILTTDSRMRTLPAGVAMFVGNNQSSYYGPMIAATVVSIVPLVLVYLCLQRQFITGIARSGIKD